MTLHKEPPQKKEKMPVLRPRDEACVVCNERDTNNSGNNPQRQMLLCDRCKRGAHRGCLSTRSVMPLEGDWLCPLCRKSGDAAEVAIGRHRRRARLTSATELVYDDEPGVTYPVNLDEMRWRWLRVASAAGPGAAGAGPGAGSGVGPRAGVGSGVKLTSNCLKAFKTPTNRNNETKTSAGTG